jgi:hypothetical protein
MILRFLNLGTNWRWIVSLTSRPLYPWGKSPRFALEKRLGGPQHWSVQHGGIKILVPTGNRTPTTLAIQPVASRYTDYAIPSVTCTRKLNKIMSRISKGFRSGKKRKETKCDIGLCVSGCHGLHPCCVECDTSRSNFSECQRAALTVCPWELSR